MPRPKKLTEEEALKVAQQAFEAAQTRLAAAKTAAAEKKEKDDRHRKIILGATIETALANGSIRLAEPDPANPGKWIFIDKGVWLDRTLKRPHDRAVFVELNKPAATEKPQ